MGYRLKILALGIGVSIGSALTSASADATTVVALTGNKRLMVVQTTGVNAPRVVRQLDVRISGRLAGIDVRAADGLLYGVTTAGQIVTINTRTGAATASGNLTLPLPSAQVSVDINPVADAIRIVGLDGTNLRHPFATGTTVADTAINFPPPPAPPNPFGDTTPGVIAIAYTNAIPGANIPGTTATQLIDIDPSPPALYLQTPANSGTLSALGRITGGALGSSLGFDIFVDRQGQNVGLIVTRNRLLRIDVVGGAITASHRIRGLAAAVRDLAALR